MLDLHGGMSRGHGPIASAESDFLAMRERDVKIALRMLHARDPREPRYMYPPPFDGVKSAY